MNVVAIIQARMGSTRLPGKVLKLIGPYPCIYHVYHRTRRAVPNTVVAIPNTPADQPLREYLETQDIPHVVSDLDENDVLGRYYDCAVTFSADVIVRVTADCPFIDPEYISRATRRFVQQYPIGKPGSSTTVKYWAAHVLRYLQIFSMAALSEAHANAHIPFDRQHVWPYMGRLIGSGIPTTPGELRCVLDTPDDYAWFQRIAREIDCTPPHPTTAELLALIERKPELGRYEA